MKRLCFVSVFVLLAFVAASVGAFAQKKGLKNFYSKEHKVGFRYLADWKAEAVQGAADDAPEFNVIAVVKPTKSAERAYRNTNYADASAELSVASVSEQQCQQKFPNPSEPPEVPHRLKIGNNIFYRVEQGEGATGHFYDTITYHTFHDGKCYQIATEVHTLNLMTLRDTDKSIRAVNDNQLGANLETVVRSLYF